MRHQETTKTLKINNVYFSLLESEIDLRAENDKYKDYCFTKWLTKNVGVQGIPPSAFYSEPHKTLGEKLVRFCFIKVC